MACLAPELAGGLAAGRWQVVVIDALPGTGKSRLLRQVAQWLGAAVRPAPDIGLAGVQAIEPAHGITIDLAALAGPAILVAPRAGVSGRARARLHGVLRDVGNAELFLTRESDPEFDRSGGWPALSGHFARAPDDQDTPALWLAESVWPRLDASARPLLFALSSGAEVVPEQAMSIEERRAAAALVPLLRCDGQGWRLVVPALGPLFARALAPLPVPARATALLAAAGRPARAISLALAARRRGEALAILHQAGGMMMGHIHGPDAARQASTAFGADPDPEVTGLRTQTALKSGQTERAALILEDRLGHVPRPMAQAMADSVALSLRLSELILAPYRPETDVEAALARLPRFLSEIAEEAPLKRGLVYNMVLDLQFRAGRLGEAEATAARALTHYGAGGAPYLCFYIHVYRALIGLVAGDLRRARAPLSEARAALGATPFETPQDALFLALLEAAIAYEEGDAEPMAIFAETRFGTFAFGELWPAVADIALRAGAGALVALRGADAAHAYLDAWRVQNLRTRSFRLQVEQQEVAVLQRARRWREARAVLERMPQRIGRVWIEAADTALSDLSAPEDIAQAMLWLRQLAFERPRDAALAGRLPHLAGNRRLSARQTAALGIWRAWSARRHGRVGEARRHLAQVLHAAETSACRAPVIEERTFVLPLVDDPRMQGGPMRDAPVPAHLRRGAAPAFGSGPLTAQEWRALLLLAEGASNKEIAREMALSVATVKFHLRNLYRKLGAADRRGALAAARAAGLFGG